MTRRMRDLAFRDDQMARRYTGTVGPINRFIDKLGAKDEAGHPPYIPRCIGESMRWPRTSLPAG